MWNYADGWYEIKHRKKVNGLRNIACEYGHIGNRILTITVLEMFQYSMGTLVLRYARFASNQFSENYWVSLDFVCIFICKLQCHRLYDENKKLANPSYS
jgi:hypothetical protein